MFLKGDKVYVWEASVNNYATNGTDPLIGEVMKYPTDDIVQIRSAIDDSVFLAKINECHIVGTGPAFKNKGWRDSDIDPQSDQCANTEPHTYDWDSLPHDPDFPDPREPEKSDASIFDMEQRYMSAWQMVDDLKAAAEYICDHPDFEGMDPKHSDKIFNLLFGIVSLYELKFNLGWEEFEKLCSEYHLRGKLSQRRDR